MLRSGYAITAITATITTKQGGDDIINPESELDSLSDTNDKSKESESDRVGIVVQLESDCLRHPWISVLKSPGIDK